MKGMNMDITTIIINGFMGGLAAMIAVFICELFANWMTSKEQVCVIPEKGNRK
jgi:hypothetical protein|tara:strand:+ start:253 stop:411 length:159 start_codon:yes stop_codon:yes gene_type:complete